MRILYFSQAYGDALFISNQVREVEKTHTVKYVCCQLHPDSALPQYRLGDVKVVPLEFPALVHRFLRRLEHWDLHVGFWHPAFAKRLARVIAEFNPDVIHCQFGYEALILLDNSYDPRRKYVISFMGFDASSKLRLGSYRRKIADYLSRPNVFPIFCSDYLRRNLVGGGISFSPRNIVLYFGTNTAFFRRRSYSHPRDPLLFVQVSTFAEKKGHPYTLRAFRIFRDRNPDVKFRLVLTGGPGRISEYENVRRLVAELELSDVVDFVGYTTPEQTRDLLERSHFFVQHSFTPSDGNQEGMPNSIMEAMAMELPVVSTFHSGIPELVADGVNGFLVPEKDVEAYASKLEEVVRWGYVKANREKIEDRFEIGKHNDSLLRFYGEL